MAGRGSGIGQMWGASSPGQGGGRAQSTVTQGTYGQAGTTGLGFVGGKASLAGAPSWLLGLVLAEAAVMVALRHGFRHHHGG